MKIIQSYAHFSEGSPRLNGVNKNKIFLNFYSFLLSYLTLKKYYGNVAMYCNESGYEKIVKHIPYDEINIIENNNSVRFWSYYKIDTIRQMNQDFIHVDSDVFIFDDLFSSFINNGGYDNIVQNIIPESYNYVKDYVKNYNKFIVENDIINPEKYDRRCHGCGVIGMRCKHKDGYVEMCDKIKKNFEENDCTDIGFIGMVCEELASYLYSLKHVLNTYQIIPYDDILKYGSENVAANYHNYTHLYLDSKFKPKYVKLVRNKILKEFVEATEIVEKYEKDVMKRFKFLDLIK
jgi:hypothetical protein